MPAPDKVNIVVAEWVQKAEDDLRAAQLLLDAGRNCPMDITCFHIQQCIEKYLKALLVLRLVDFRKTHSISELLALIPDAMPFRISDLQQKRLLSYATVMRYPGNYEPVSAKETHDAMRLCKKVRHWVRSLLPKSALKEEIP
jgi:HEPN domain-containing protein